MVLNSTGLVPCPYIITICDRQRDNISNISFCLIAISYSPFLFEYLLSLIIMLYYYDDEEWWVVDTYKAYDCWTAIMSHLRRMQRMTMRKRIEWKIILNTLKRKDDQYYTIIIPIKRSNYNWAKLITTLTHYEDGSFAQTID